MLTSTAKQASPGCITSLFTLPPPDSSGDGAEEGEGSEEDEEVGKQTFQLLLANKNEVKKNEDIRKTVVKYIDVPCIRSHEDVLSPSIYTTYGRFLRDIVSDSSQ